MPYTPGNQHRGQPDCEHVIFPSKKTVFTKILDLLFQWQLLRCAKIYFYPPVTDCTINELLKYFSISTLSLNGLKFSILFQWRIFRIHPHIYQFLAGFIHCLNFLIYLFQRLPHFLNIELTFSTI